jgi:replicative DNA helicase
MVSLGGQQRSTSTITLCQQSTFITTTPLKVFRKQPSVHSADYLSNVEHGLAGLALVDPAKAAELGLRPEWFRDLRVRRVWDISLHLSDSNFSGSPNSADVEAALLDGVDEEHASNWLTFMAECAGTYLPTGAEHTYAEKVKTAYIRRCIRSICHEAGSAVQETDDVGSVVQHTVEQLEDVVQIGAAERPTLQDEVQAEMERVAAGEGNVAGLPSGVGLERVVPGGIPRDKVTVLFGETGTFKTTLKANIIDAIALSNQGLVLDFSLEDNNELTAQRALSRASGVGYGKFATRDFSDEEKAKIAAASATTLAAYRNVVVVGDVVPTADEIIRTARQYLARGLVAVVVDYLTLLDWGTMSEREMINHAMVKFQRAAKRDKVAYIIVSQVNEEKIHGDPRRTDKRPQLRDLFGSSTIKNASKLAVAVHRPAKFGAPTSRLDKAEYGEVHSQDPAKYERILELIVRKNVIGVSDVAIKVDCDLETGRMRAL